MLMQGLLLAACYLFYAGSESGHPDSGGVGIRDRQLRLVDRYRPRGTLISAILLLLKQDWRTSINRFAEAMTLSPWRRRDVPHPAPGTALAGVLADAVSQFDVAVAAAAQPADLGRIRGIHLCDGVAAVLVRGLVPDLATMRDRALRPWVKMVYGMLALGCAVGAHWSRYQMAYLLLGGLATPLVVSVHTVVSFDFAISLIPGWHTTIFPPYFVAGAIYSGFAMVLSLAIPTRKWFTSKTSSPCATSTAAPSDAGHRAHRRVWLHDGIVHGLVQRQSVRSFHDENRQWGNPYGPSTGCSSCATSRFRNCCGAQGAPEYHVAVPYFPGGERRDVAGAVHYRHHSLHRDFLRPCGAITIQRNGTGPPTRNYRVLPGADAAVCPRAAASPSSKFASAAPSRTQRGSRSEAASAAESWRLASCHE